MNWKKVIASLEAQSLSEAKKAQINISEAAGGYNRGQELQAVANRQKIGANILLQLATALKQGLSK